MFQAVRPFLEPVLAGRRDRLASRRIAQELLIRRAGQRRTQRGKLALLALAPLPCPPAARLTHRRMLTIIGISSGEFRLGKFVWGNSSGEIRLGKFVGASCRTPADSRQTGAEAGCPGSPEGRGASSGPSHSHCHCRRSIPATPRCNPNQVERMLGWVTTPAAAPTPTQSPTPPSPRPSPPAAAAPARAAPQPPPECAQPGTPPPHPPPY